MKTNPAIAAPDLTQRPPRSPRIRLGGYTILPRILDNARAEIAGTAGEYKYKNPNDWHFFRFTGIDPDALLELVKTGAGDWEILLWVNANAPLKRNPLAGKEIRSCKTIPLFRKIHLFQRQS